MAVPVHSSASSPASPKEDVTQRRLPRVAAPRSASDSDTVQSPHDASHPGPLAGIVQQLLLEGRPKGATVIGVTSAIAGEGKTTIAAELARRLGLQVGQGGRVLLVDCCLTPSPQPNARWKFWKRRPRRQQLTPEDFPKEGPCEYRSLASVLETGQRAGAAGLHNSLEPLRDQYRFIVLDMPALLNNLSAPIMSREADRLFLVVRAGSTDAGRIQRAMAQLEDQDRERFEGVILNRARSGDRL